MKELIERVKQKDEHAIKELYDLTYRKAYVVALSFMGSQDKVDDVLQNAYINIFNHIHELENPEHLYSWINTIVVNACKSELRKKQNYSFSDMDYEDDIEEEHKEFIPDKNVNYEEDRKVVVGFINELPLEQRSALIMHIYEDMKISEIAKIFDCSENTIKSRLNYAKKTLKEKIMAYKNKGNTLFSIPLIPYLRFILDENAIHVSNHQDLIVSSESVKETMTSLSHEVSKHVNTTSAFVLNYWHVVNTILAMLVALTVYTPPPADPVKVENKRVEMLDVYENQYLNGTSFEQVLRGYYKSHELLREYMLLNDNEEETDYYNTMFATSEMAPLYRAYLANKDKPDYVQLFDVYEDSIKDIVCYYEREIDNPGKYDRAEDYSLIRSSTLKLNFCKILVVDGEKGIVDAGDLFKDYKYARVTNVKASKEKIFIDCMYGKTYNEFIHSNYTVVYKIENGKLKRIGTYDSVYEARTDIFGEDSKDIVSHVIDQYEDYR